MCPLNQSSPQAASLGRVPARGYMVAGPRSLAGVSNFALVAKPPPLGEGRAGRTGPARIWYSLKEMATEQPPPSSGARRNSRTGAASSMQGA